MSHFELLQYHDSFLFPAVLLLPGVVGIIVLLHNPNSAKFYPLDRLPHIWLQYFCIVQLCNRWNFASWSFVVTFFFFFLAEKSLQTKVIFASSFNLSMQTLGWSWLVGILLRCSHLLNWSAKIILFLRSLLILVFFSNGKLYKYFIL